MGQHNFISDRLASMLHLPVVPTETFTVRVANGERLKCQGCFDKVVVNIQGIEFYLTLFSLPLSGLNLVLGIQWLEMLGSVVCNWKQLTMEFIWDNQAQRLQGIGEQAIQEATLQEISKECRRGHALFAVSFPPTTKAASQGAAYDEKQQDMLRILHKYEDVFQKPLCIPLVREVDHYITLKEGTEPSNVHPYRYAHFQKEEIERQVQEMLNSELIHPNTSPFSSPILLVKKKMEVGDFA